MGRWVDRRVGIAHPNPQLTPPPRHSLQKNSPTPRRAQHEAALAAYRDIERKYFLNCETLPLAARFRYITLRNGIHYETSWLTWCGETLATLATLPVG
ncbi:MAG: hypothetical protein EA368_12980 [Leptolyngbya sp. DLM2.Bin27]|nr:MAG: hypothetical protein EA368_12980 [Leptolyngbya sp. DLM2.Bin27]